MKETRTYEFHIQDEYAILDRLTELEMSPSDLMDAMISCSYVGEFDPLYLVETYVDQSDVEGGVIEAPERYVWWTTDPGEGKVLEGPVVWFM